MSVERENTARRETTAVLGPGQTYASVTDRITGIVVDRPLGRGWVLAFGATFLLVLAFLVAVTWLFVRGVGIWGINIPVAWGFAIINFVWWIGIGHAGTFISAFLLLMRQQWRTSINRFAEAMTLFAVACAGMMPLLHLGRPYYFYWLLPYPNTMALWPQFRSPLVWDVFAVSTYGTVSLLFWYLGLVPDLASCRDRARGRLGRVVFGLLALGWRNSARHWHNYRMAYLLLGGLATPLVISVHSVVGLDFTAAIVPGWHSTIFPPYFVAGAIFSGFAMVIMIAVPLRAVYGLRDMITLRHLDNCAKLMLVTGLIVDYAYVWENFMAWYSGSPYERYAMLNRALGAYAPLYWVMLACNIGVNQLLWFRRVRTTPMVLFGVALLIQVGMWLERFVIIVSSLQRDYVPSAWWMYYPTIWDVLTFIGTLGVFSWLFLLFIRSLPAIAVSEMRELVHEEAGEAVKAAGQA